MSNTNPFVRNASKPVIASDLRFGNNSERAIGRNDELNASSKKDLMQQITNLMQVASTQGIVTEDEAKQRHQANVKRKQAIAEAWNSKEAFAVLGEVMAEDLYIAANRQGFARRFLVLQQLAQGQDPRCKMYMKNVVAQVAGSMSQMQAQLVRDNWYTPPEFYNQTRVFIEQREISRSTTDVLEEKFIEAIEGIMVAEDRLWLKLAKSSVGSPNAQTMVMGMMNPATLATFRNQVTRWNIPAVHWLIANDIWTDIVGDQGFSSLLEPVSKHQLLLTGQLGTMLGMTVISDGFRHPQHKVLDQGEMLVIGAAINHGQITDRGGIESTPIDISHTEVPGRGYHLVEQISMVVANSRSVAYGKRQM